jgi:hypothetical protein
VEHSTDPIENGRNVADEERILTGATNAISCATCVKVFRAVNTTYPVQCGGDLSSDQTISLAFGTTTENSCKAQAYHTRQGVYLRSDSVILMVKSTEKRP